MWSSIIPNPLHPAIVHLPMAIVVLLPLTVIGAIWVIRRGAAPPWRPRRYPSTTISQLNQLE